MKHVWVEIGAAELNVVRIFKSRSAASRSGMIIALMDRGTAVKAIRHQLWLRCKGECELCSERVTEASGHMHEQKWRGKGGEVSLDNSVFVCPRTHELEHKTRNTKFLKKRLTSGTDSGNLQPDSSTPGHRVNEATHS